MTRRILSVALTIAVAALALSAVSPAQAADAEMAVKLYNETHKCNMCHAVPGAEIEAKTKSDKMKGPDLGGEIEVDFAAMAAYVRKEGEIDGKTHKKPFKGTDEELQTILDWLGSLEAQE